MKQIPLILIFLLTTFLCFGQKEHLEPVRSFIQYEVFKDLKEYYDNVFSKLHEGFSQTPYARYTSIPSFSKEYAFSVEIIDDKHYIISNSFSENFWYAKKRNNVKLINNKVEIDNTLYSKIGELFQILIDQMKISENGIAGTDGTTYYFATTNKNGKIKIGETWSPNKGSLLNRLVIICNNLHLLGIGDNINQTEIIVEITQLINDLKK